MESEWNDLHTYISISVKRRLGNLLNTEILPDVQFVMSLKHIVE